jgi:hypothetical protein
MQNSMILIKGVSSSIQNYVKYDRPKTDGELNNLSYLRFWLFCLESGLLAPKDYLIGSPIFLLRAYMMKTFIRLDYI